MSKFPFRKFPGIESKVILSKIIVHIDCNTFISLDDETLLNG